jgi:hypothetical protein
MMAGAIEMLAAGVVLMIASTLTGEKLTQCRRGPVFLPSPIWLSSVRLSPLTPICI